MKKSKYKILLCLLLFSLLLSGCEGDYGYYGKADILPLVEQWREDVEFYADMYGIAEYVDVLLAIIAQESGGDAEKTPDIMQCSASAGLPANSITEPVESIRQGVWYFSSLLTAGTSKGVDMDSVIQAYNFGGGYIDYIGYSVPVIGTSKTKYGQEHTDKRDCRHAVLFWFGTQK